MVWLLEISVSGARDAEANRVGELLRKVMARPLRGNVCGGLPVGEEDFPRREGNQSTWK